MNTEVKMTRLGNLAGRRLTPIFLLGSMLSGGAGARLYAQLQAPGVTTSVASPQPLGTTITFTASATDSNPNPVTYRFETSPDGVNFSVVKDYSLDNILLW